MNTDRRAIYPEHGPRPGGPYSPAIVSGGFVFLAGQVGRDPVTGQLSGVSIEAQTRQTLENIGTLLRAAGCNFPDVVKANVYLVSPEFFQPFNAIYQAYFPEPRPARTTVVSQLMDDGLLLEVDVTARLPG